MGSLKRASGVCILIILTNVDEGTLRRYLFEYTGGSYPEVRYFHAGTGRQYLNSSDIFSADNPWRYQSLPATHWYVFRG